MVNATISGTGAGRSNDASRPRRGGRVVRVPASVVLVALIGALLGHGVAAVDQAFRSSTFSGPLPACGVDDVAAPHASLAEWGQTLLDTTYAIDRSYVPDDLTPTGEAGITGGGSVRAFMIIDLEALGRAGRKAGQAISVGSAYRSFDAQARTFASLVRAFSHDYALRSAARPGHSEHQLGTTIDFVGGEAWLADNAWRFGFVMSYPPARSPALTCYRAEPWHFRYFGRSRAAEIESAGISPREWLWQHADDGR